MGGVDDLFSGDGPAAPVEDRLRTIWRVLLIAAPLNACGITCFTGVPGAALTLWAWQLAEEERARVESGALPAERGGPVGRARSAAFGMLIFVAASLVAQIFLFTQGFYEWALGALVSLF